MVSSDFEKWLEAIKYEMQSMYDNQVWSLIHAFKGIKTIRCKWVFKKKTDMDGNMHTYKARLVAKGFRQTHDGTMMRLFHRLRCLCLLELFLPLLHTMIKYGKWM